uniref:Protein LURP-one-related 11 n=1 Tax=Anthurium amnicola TaxID=1678845 RepID=A0A1D1Z190_9ARAE
MGRVYPQPVAQASSSSSTSPPPTSQREVFTIWMKSLVLNGNGCTVYDSKGRLAYRVDNYDCKRADEVYLMDLPGKVLFKILRRKKLHVLGRWEGYRCSGSEEQLNPSFRVKKPVRIFSRDAPCEVTVFDADSCCYRIDGVVCKSAYKITDVRGELVAEMKRKQTASGVVMGDDVLTLVVKPNSDLPLVMALVVVCGLISHHI